MKTIFRFTTLIALLISISGNAFSAITLTTTTTHDAPQNIKVGDNFNFKVNYAWSAASNGNHTLQINVVVPPMLDFVSSDLGTNITLTADRRIIFTLPNFVANPSKGTSGSGNFQVKVRFKPTTLTTEVRACLVGTISEGTSSANIGGTSSCAVLPGCTCTALIRNTNLAGAVIVDLGTIQSTLPCNDPQKVNDCIAKVQTAFNQRKQDIANSACTKNVATGTTLRAFFRLGSQQYQPVPNPVGVLTNTSATATSPKVCKIQ